MGKIDIWTIQEGDMDASTVYYDNEAPSMEQENSYFYVVDGVITIW